MNYQKVLEQPVEALLPHSGDMVFLDQVIACEEHALVSRVVIRDNCPLFDHLKGHMPAWVGIEWMAQSVSAMAGVHRLADGKDVLLGFLLGARSYQSYCDSFTLGEELIVRVNRNYQEGDLGAFDCLIERDGKIVAEATITAFQPEDYQAYLQE